MKSTSLFLALCFLITTAASAQEVYNSSGRRTPMKKKVDHHFDPTKLIFGGGISFQIDNGILGFGISPIVGYRITDKLSAGIGLSYQVISAKNYLVLTDPITQVQTGYDYKASVLTPSVWARYIVYENFFVQGSVEQNFQSFTDVRYDPNGSGQIQSYNRHYSSTAAFVGGGLRQPMTSNSSFVIMLLYDVIGDKYSPYPSRLDYRIGFNVGF
ncbi:MAG: hypothetical protein ABI378_14800 [Chitinophagaceae bacterium]